jgi:hypothetical protein
LLVRWYGPGTPSRSRSSTLELCHREYVRERKIKVESRRQRTKTDSRLRDDAGDPVARPRDELATVKLAQRTGSGGATQPNPHAGHFGVLSG